MKNPKHLHQNPLKNITENRRDQARLSTKITLTTCYFDTKPPKSQKIPVKTNQKVPKNYIPYEFQPLEFH